MELSYFKNNKEVKFDLDQINELRDRALLIQHTSLHNKKQMEDQTKEE